MRNKMLVIRGLSLLSFPYNFLRIFSLSIFMGNFSLKKKPPRSFNNEIVKWTSSWENLTPWNRFKPYSSKIFLLTVPRRCFLCGSFMLFLFCFCYVFMRICLLMPCGHLLGNDWPLGFRMWCLIVKLSLSHWYPRRVWCFNVSIPDLCPLSYFSLCDLVM